MAILSKGKRIIFNGHPFFILFSRYNNFSDDFNFLFKILSKKHKKRISDADLGMASSIITGDTHLYADLGLFIMLLISTILEIGVYTYNGYVAVKYWIFAGLAVMIGIIILFSPFTNSFKKFRVFK